MQLGCEVSFSDEDVKKCSDNALYRKYTRFIQNVVVDLDPDLAGVQEQIVESMYDGKAKSKRREVASVALKFV